MSSSGATYASDQEIHALNDRAWALRYDDIPRALSIATRASELAGPPDQPRAPRELADSLRTLSHCNERLGIYTTAIEQANQALAFYRELGDQAGEATTRYLIASSSWSIGSYSDALIHAQAAAELGEQAGNQLAQAKALNILGLIHQSTNATAEALRYYQASHAISEQIGDQRGMADALYNAADTYLQRGQPADALPLAEQSLALHDTIAYHFDLGMALALVGKIHAAQGQYAEAHLAFSQGLVASEMNGNTYSRILCLIPLGSLAREAGDTASAHTLLEQALALTHEIEAKEERCQCHHELAMIYEQQGIIDQALDQYRTFHILREELRTNSTMQQLQVLELSHQVERARQEREYYRQKHTELAIEVEERARVERELRQRIAEISILHRVNQLVVHHSDFTAMLDQVSRDLLGITQACDVIIALLDAQQEVLSFAAANDRNASATSIMRLSLPIGAVPACIELLRYRVSMTVTHEQAATKLGPLNQRFQEANLLRLQIIPLLVRGEVIGGLVLTADELTPTTPVLAQHVLEAIAGQVAAAIEHARLFEEAQRARAAAESASQAKSQFLATMSHEIRTPLTGVLGYTQLLQLDPSIQPQHLEQIGFIERAGQHLLLLLNDILDLARIEADKLQLEESVVSLPLLLHESVAVFAMEAQRKGLDLQLVIADELEGALPEHVRIDARRLRQVFMNLLGNAIKFTDHGSVMCIVRAAHSSAHANRPGVVWLGFAIRDTGMGIDEVDLPLVMSPFHQSSEASRKSGGTGLGLAICSELLRRMGSELHVQSARGVGSTFFFDLPLALSEVGSQGDADQRDGWSAYR